MDCQVIISNSRKETLDSLSAIIEVKGCWNREITHAMKTQLVGRYLNDNKCQYGLYVVGWFNCDQWDEDDYRKKDAPKCGLIDTKNMFDFQATELSKQNVIVNALVINMALR